MSDLLSMLPLYEQSSQTFREIMSTQQIEFDELEINIADLSKQLLIDTATWALAIYEEELGLETDLSKPLVERRSKIKAKWRGSGTVSKERIKAVVDSFTNGNVDVAFDGNIQVIFNDILGVPENMDDVYGAIENVVPAHLRVIYEFVYRTYKDLKKYTHQELSNYTYETLREGEI